MKTAIVIPARYQSVRFPAKPLAPIVGASGIAKSLIVRCIEAAGVAAKGARIVVATDDRRIADEAASVGADIAMTSPQCRNGSERVAEAVTRLDFAPDIVVNFQGDALLTPPWFVAALLNALDRDGSVEMATPVLPFDAAALEKMQRDLLAGQKGPTSVVCAQNGDALYFSKQILPYRDDPGAGPAVLQHVGLYAYRAAALAAYAALEPTPLELSEGLEQLRLLESGHRIRTVPVEAHDRIPWEVNLPDDIPVVEAELVRLGIA